MTKFPLPDGVTLEDVREIIEELSILNDSKYDMALTRKELAILQRVEELAR